jgi:hypothetical protein
LLPSLPPCAEVRYLALSLAIQPSMTFVSAQPDQGSGMITWRSRPLAPPMGWSSKRVTRPSRESTRDSGNKQIYRARVESILVEDKRMTKLTCLFAMMLALFSLSVASGQRGKGAGAGRAGAAGVKAGGASHRGVAVGGASRTGVAVGGASRTTGVAIGGASGTGVAVGGASRTGVAVGGASRTGVAVGGASRTGAAVGGAVHPKRR